MKATHKSLNMDAVSVFKKQQNMLLKCIRIRLECSSG